MITIGWRDVTAQEAMELGLEQPARWQWSVFEVGAFGYGITLGAKARQL